MKHRCLDFFVSVFVVVVFTVRREIHAPAIRSADMTFKADSALLFMLLIVQVTSNSVTVTSQQNQHLKEV